MVGYFAREVAYGIVAFAIALVLGRQVAQIWGIVNTPWEKGVALVIGVACGASAVLLANGTIPRR